MILGCAGATPQQSLKGNYTDSEDNKCIKECAISYWECESYVNVRAGRGVLVQQGVSEALNACRLSLNRCANSCPDR
jgi:hypothetical protein